MLYWLESGVCLKVFGLCLGRKSIYVTNLTFLIIQSPCDDLRYLANEIAQPGAMSGKKGAELPYMWQAEQLVKEAQGEMC